MADTPNTDVEIIPDLILTHDTDGTVIGIHPETRLTQVQGYEKLLKRENENEFRCDDHRIYYTMGDGTEHHIDINNDIISNQDIIEMWGTTEAREKSY